MPPAPRSPGRSQEVPLSRSTYSAALLTLLATAACGPKAPPDEIEIGRTLYRARGCAVCHGDNGAGDGPAGKVLATPPRDLRLAASFRGPRTVEAIATVIANGTETGMPAQAFLPQGEREKIAKFVLSLAEPAQPPGGPSSP